MKKIIWIAFFIVFSISFLEAAGIYDDPCINWATQECCCENPNSMFCWWMGYDCNGRWNDQWTQWNNQQNWNTQPSWNTQLTWNTIAGVWMTINTDCLIKWQCGMNLYELLWIRRRDTTPTVMSLIQDVILAATTFVWTVIVIALVVSGLLFAIASISWKDTKRAKTIMIDCFVWLLLVMWSYTIIRLIQFLAMAWK